ncbi:MAG: GGDEF domain-containing protein [Planctomycetota bacterium]
METLWDRKVMDFGSRLIISSGLRILAFQPALWCALIVGITSTALILWLGITGLWIAIPLSVVIGIGGLKLEQLHRRSTVRRLAAQVRAGLGAECIADLAPLLAEHEKSELAPVAEAAHACLAHFHSRRVETNRLEREIAERVRAEARQVEAHLTQLSQTDPLTSLLNRRGFDAHFGGLIGRSQRTHVEAALLAIDLDRFKDLNDTCGHEAGDRALSVLGDVVNGCVRERDIAARVGGDEILIALTGVDLHQATTIANRLREQFAAQRPIDSLWPTLSIGVAMLHAHKADCPSGLRRMADLALYASKNNGRDRVTPWSPSLAASNILDTSGRTTEAVSSSKLVQPITGREHA